MKTTLHPDFAGSPRAQAAREIIGKCVHCGFCNATCPTYLELSDERDGPRGRIYLIRQLLESGAASRLTQRHLDRCLTCRACETTCPSGVSYGQLVDFGREALEERASRAPAERALRRVIRWLVPYRRRFGSLLRLGQALHDAEEYQEGADLFSKVLKTQPRERDALFGLGLCKIGLNELEDAVGIFERLIESDRAFNDYEPWILLSQSLWGLGRREEALELLEQLVKTSPRTRHAVTHAHFELEAGNPERAHAILREALEHYEHAPKFVKRNDRSWARQAKKMIKTVGSEQTVSAQ